MGMYGATYSNKFTVDEEIASDDYRHDFGRFSI